MAQMMIFTTWFIQQLPTFLLAEPISAFTGLCILAWVAEIFWRMCGLASDWR